MEVATVAGGERAIFGRHGEQEAVKGLGLFLGLSGMAVKHGH